MGRFTVCRDKVAEAVLLWLRDGSACLPIVFESEYSSIGFIFLQLEKLLCAREFCFEESVNVNSFKLTVLYSLRLRVTCLYIPNITLFMLL
jgi:hypothetical protein